MDDPIDVETLLWPVESGSPKRPFLLQQEPLEKPRSKTQMYQQSYFPFSTKKWFDVKVFYVRASSCLPGEAPDYLLIVYPQRSRSTELEFNGCRVSPLERLCFTLRRDRLDAGAAEATYVSTNNIRVTGDLPFEIYDKDDMIVHGTLSRTAAEEAHVTVDGGYASVPYSLAMLNEPEWSMECSCGISSSSCCFLKGRTDFSNVNPTMEVYVAGRSSDLPIVLTTTVKLIVRKRLKHCTMGVIPEIEEDQLNQVLAKQIHDDETYEKMWSRSVAMNIADSLYMPIDDQYFEEGEGGELSWFNAGVRVGVGIGLGLCLGVGIGVGLLVRPLKRRIL